LPILAGRQKAWELPGSEEQQTAIARNRASDVHWRLVHNAAAHVRVEPVRSKATKPRRRQGTSGVRESRRAPTTKGAGRAAAGGRGPGRRRSAEKPAEDQASRAERAGRILSKLRVAYPDATCALHHRNAYELLVATVLSAQCTDERVNQVTPDLFRRYPTAAALAAAEPAELEAAIRSTGFFRNKARNLLGMARLLCERHDGQVPASMEELLRLPGVARKTANCVLGTWFGQNVGIVVDTHVGRLAERLGLIRTARDSKDAERIEHDLMELFPQADWTYLAHALILHGRRVCLARKPKCGECLLAADCPSAEGR